MTGIHEPEVNKVEERHLHIVSFDVPFPPNYGGVIDVYYKIRALAERGVRIHLHCFLYSRKPSPELESLCHRIYYYHRKTGLLSNISFLPYIVYSRRSDILLENLLRDDYPILFEGLHTCYYLPERRLAGRLLVYRESNIEHHYYGHLSRAVKSKPKKAFFYIESLRLHLFQRKLRHAGLILAVSEADQGYLQNQFPQTKVVLLPSFHRENSVDILPGKGTYALYHGKLNVPENEQAAIYLIEKVWMDDMPQLVIAGMDPSGELIKSVHGRSNIRIIPDPLEAEMTTLIRNAHVHVMVTFQPTGLKLKLLKSLFNGRFCLVNRNMLTGTTLLPLCHTAETPAGIRKAIHDLFGLEFDAAMINQRISFLSGSDYSNHKNCTTLLDLLTLSK